MPLVNAIPAWGLEMGAGSLQQWDITLTLPTTGLPYPIAGATWEYIARTAPGGTPVIELTTSASAGGVINVTSTGVLSLLLLAIYPAATQPLAGTYYHSLWMNPGADGALCVFTGPLIITAIPQP